MLAKVGMHKVLKSTGVFLDVVPDRIGNLMFDESDGEGDVECWRTWCCENVWIAGDPRAKLTMLL